MSQYCGLDPNFPRVTQIGVFPRVGAAIDASNLVFLDQIWDADQVFGGGTVSF